MKMKAISYAYPSSPDAARFGFPKTGCYTVEEIEGSNPPVAKSGHATKKDAIDAALTNDLPWSKYTL